MAHNRFISILSVFAGVLLIIGGLSLIGSYIFIVVQSIGQADSSLIFWQIPIVLFGVLLSAAGAFYITIGYKSRTKPAFQKLSKNSLIALFFTLVITISYVWIGEFRADQERKELQVQHRILTELMEIEKVEIRNLTTEAFTLYFSAAGEQTGDYEMTVNIYDSQDEIYQISELHSLSNSENDIVTNLTFDKIFEACRDESSINSSYFCVDNAGTSNTKLSIKITLKPYSLNNVEFLPAHVETSWTTSLFLDTMTRNGLVNVINVNEE
jgi:hypothetical protein